MPDSQRATTGFGWMSRGFRKHFLSKEVGAKGRILHSPNSSAPLSPTNSFEIITGAYAAEPEDTASGQVLTVVARPEQTLKEISLLYAGHFDLQLLKDICAINPELKDPNHIEAGQLTERVIGPQSSLEVWIAENADNDSKMKPTTTSDLKPISCRPLVGMVVGIISGRSPQGERQQGKNAKQHKGHKALIIISADPAERV
jgi:hypothetical protein